MVHESFLHNNSSSRSNRHSWLLDVVELTYKMPHLKEPKKAEPLWKEWDYKAQKKGFRNTVYSVNGDEYTGEWQNNKKEGKKRLQICM